MIDNALDYEGLKYYDEKNKEYINERLKGENISYNNANTDLSSTDVQSAIDELANASKIPDGVTYIDFNDSEETGEIIPLNADTLDGYDSEYFASKEELDGIQNNENFGQGYGTCSTAANTKAKIVSLSDYTLVKGGIVVVNFTNYVPANATMNINEQGDKPIYNNGKAITRSIIQSGDFATFMYDGSVYHLLSVSRTSAFSALPVSAGGTGATNAYDARINLGMGDYNTVRTGVAEDNGMCSVDSAYASNGLGTATEAYLHIVTQDISYNNWYTVPINLDFDIGISNVFNKDRNHFISVFGKFSIVLTPQYLYNDYNSNYNFLTGLDINVNYQVNNQSDLKFTELSIVIPTIDETTADDDAYYVGDSGYRVEVFLKIKHEIPIYKMFEKSDGYPSGFVYVNKRKSVFNISQWHDADGQGYYEVPLISTNPYDTITSRDIFKLEFPEDEKFHNGNATYTIEQ